MADPTSQVLAAGVPQSFLDQQASLGKAGTFNGSNLDPQDVSKTIAAWNSPGNQIPQQISQLASQQFQFNPQDYLPGIQQQADSLYSPQIAQLEAIRSLQNSQSADTKITTENDFKKRLQAETEAINRRGAFFSGGAIQNEQDIRDQQARAMQQITLQQQAANFGLIAQEAGLNAEQQKYVQDQLFNAQGGAYSRFSDQRQFQMAALQTQYQVYSSERQYARDVFTSDRAFNQSAKQFQMQYNLSTKEFQLAQDKFKEDTRQFNEQFAFDKFKFQQGQKDAGGQGSTKDMNAKVAAYAAQAASGAITREAAAGLLEVFYPGQGYKIYQAVPDNAAMPKYKPDSSTNVFG